MNINNFSETRKLIDDDYWNESLPIYIIGVRWRDLPNQNILHRYDLELRAKNQKNAINKWICFHENSLLPGFRERVRVLVVFEPSIPNGPTQCLPWLWLAGENELEIPLQSVDLWIDFRDGTGNKYIMPPERVKLVKLPFADGDYESAKIIFPKAKKIVDRARVNNSSILLSCHAGVSRSATLALWLMAEELGFEKALDRLTTIRYIEPHPAFDPIISEIKTLVKP